MHIDIASGKPYKRKGRKALLNLSSSRWAVVMRDGGIAVAKRTTPVVKCTTPAVGCTLRRCNDEVDSTSTGSTTGETTSSLQVHSSV